jgi:signal transduction histidine kinase
LNPSIRPGLALDDPVGESIDAPPEPERVGSTVSFRTRLTLGLIAAAVLPLAGFGALLLVASTLIGSAVPATVAQLLLFAIVLAALIGILIAYLLGADLSNPLRAIAAAVDRVSAGDLAARISVTGDDEVARLAESHNRLAGALERRNRELERILAAIETATPRDGVDWLVGRAAAHAKAAFELIDARIALGDPAGVPVEEVVPGDPRPIRSVLRVGGEDLGVLVGHVPATRSWDRGDQDLLELFASEIAIAIRNAQLFATVEAQNAQLLELDAVKDEFLRGVSHNLQTPLTSIRAHLEQIARDRPDPRLGIIGEQADRLSRMVRQLLTVTRLESGALKPRVEVLALGPRVRRAWEGLAAAGVEFRLDDRSGGWLAIGDGDQVDQVLWALLDNAVRYGAGSPVVAEVALAADRRLRVTIRNGGPEIPPADRRQLFGRFVRGTAPATAEGTGLGLYVSRELCRAMGGDLVLEPPLPEGGTGFSAYLPGEPPEEA